jgi:hypothetical protein
MVLAAVIAILWPALAFGESIHDSVSSAGWVVKRTASNEQRISWPGKASEQKGITGEVGSPDVPAIRVVYAIPINADTSSVEVSTAEPKWDTLQGAYELAPIPVPMQCGANGLEPVVARGKVLKDGKDVAAYSADAEVPAVPARLVTVSQARKWKLVTVAVCPFRYNPVTKTLRAAASVECEIAYTTHPLTEAERTLLRDRAPDRVVRSARNLGMAAKWYRPDGSGAPGGGGPAAAPAGITAAATPADYVIITTSAIRYRSTRINDFVAAKQAQGFSTLVVDETSWGGGTGDAAAENIRRWLQGNYVSLGIKYVLLIGDPNPDSGDVPMKACWAAVGAGYATEFPTDYYFADLTGNWDLNGNGLYGEYPFDTAPGGVDLAPEVIVGRIPCYGHIDELDAILQKLMAYETASGDVSWRKNGLIPGAILYYAQEDGSGSARGDSAAWANACKVDIFDAAGGACVRMFEKEGLEPTGDYCELPLTNENLMTEWKKGYGFVTWSGHGSPSAAARKIWSTDDGDGIPQWNEMSWKDFISSADCPSLSTAREPVVVQGSCENGSPWEGQNLQYSLLLSGAVGTVAATWLSYCVLEWDPATGASCGDDAGYGYYIPKKMLFEKMTLGEANHWCRQNFGTGMAEASYANVYDFNVYGDPSLALFPSPTPQMTITPPGGMDASGVVGGPFSPPSITYSVSSGGLAWSVACDKDWVTAASSADGTQATVTINDNAKSLPGSAAGTAYNATITFSGSGGVATRPVTLVVRSSDTGSSYFFAASDGETSTTATAWRPKATLSFAPADAGDWIVLAFAEYRGSSTSRGVRVRMTQDGSTQSEVVSEPKASSDYMSFTAVTVTALSAAMHTFEVDFCTTSAAATARIRNARIVAIRRADLEAKSGSAESTVPLATTMIDRAAVTWTPAAPGEYLLIWSAEFGGRTGYSTRLEARLNGTVCDDVSARSKDPADYYSFMSFGIYTCSATPQTMSIAAAKQRGSVGPHSIRRCRTIAIRLTGGRLAGAVSASSSSESSTASSAFSTQLTKSWTSSKDTKWLLLTSLNLSGSSTSCSAEAKVSADGTVVSGQSMRRPTKAGSYMTAGTIDVRDLGTSPHVDVSLRSARRTCTAKMKYASFVAVPLQ